MKKIKRAPGAVRIPASKSEDRRAAIRTLQGWAVGVLLDTHAIIECADHGHIKDRQSWPHGWEEARAIALSHPFPGSGPEQSLAAIDAVMASIGDVCPEC